MIDVLKRSTMTAAMLAVVAFAWASQPASADQCDDLSKQLAEQINGLKIGATRAGVIYLEHPSVSQATLGCSSKNRSNEVFAATDKRKPAPEFYDFIGTVAAQVFTIPKNDAQNGALRCVRRTNVLRGYDIKSRYRKLDISCSVAKTGVRITISREKD